VYVVNIVTKETRKMTQAQWIRIFRDGIMIGEDFLGSFFGAQAGEPFFS